MSSITLVYHFRFIEASLLTKHIVTHRGACGYSSCAFFLELDVNELVFSLAPVLSEYPVDEVSEFGKLLTLNSGLDAFAKDEMLPQESWCNAIALDAIAKVYDATILVFATCFEKPGYILKAYHGQPPGNEVSKLLTLHHHVDAFNPLRYRHDDADCLQRYYYFLLHYHI